MVLTGPYLRDICEIIILTGPCLRKKGTCRTISPKKGADWPYPQVNSFDWPISPKNDSLNASYLRGNCTAGPYIRDNDDDGIMVLTKPYLKKKIVLTLSPR